MGSGEVTGSQLAVLGVRLAPGPTGEPGTRDHAEELSGPGFCGHPTLMHTQDPVTCSPWYPFELQTLPGPSRGRNCRFKARPRAGGCRNAGGPTGMEQHPRQPSEIRFLGHTLPGLRTQRRRGGPELRLVTAFVSPAG